MFGKKKAKKKISDNNILVNSYCYGYAEKIAINNKIACNTHPNFGLEMLMKTRKLITRKKIG